MKRAIHEEVADVMPPLSHLECSVCHKKQKIGNVSNKMRYGWPKCHGYTMTLVTKKQVEEAQS